ncbi:hypothetical protein Cyrtocomes_00373 [Candidatus Cyrtobacter comes]|uniref:Uncharacterized protein n=1 Tax=Candidatus Cyrtobacter comes TaxID=675776 RepID=A0ABU5L7I4_9RICK|nr:hypothetical protein [Candidatus Cyrtobacter comes]MDZ5762007.1 hypothetical protein [Candidatus Cyrtobacter comes]
MRNFTNGRIEGRKKILGEYEVYRQLSLSSKNAISKWLPEMSDAEFRSFHDKLTNFSKILLSFPFGSRDLIVDTLLKGDEGYCNVFRERCNSLIGHSKFKNCSSSTKEDALKAAINLNAADFERFKEDYTLAHHLAPQKSLLSLLVDMFLQPSSYAATPVECEKPNTNNKQQYRQEILKEHKVYRQLSQSSKDDISKHLSKMSDEQFNNFKYTLTNFSKILAPLSSNAQNLILNEILNGDEGYCRLLKARCDSLIGEAKFRHGTSSEQKEALNAAINLNGVDFQKFVDKFGAPPSYESIYGAKPSAPPSYDESMYGTKPSAPHSYDENLYGAEPSAPPAYDEAPPAYDGWHH